MSPIPPADSFRCYKEYRWDALDAKCSGGKDPTYLDMNGSSERPRCPYYSQCAARTGQHKIQQQQQQMQAQQAHQVPIHTVFGPQQPQQPQQPLYKQPQYTGYQQQQQMVPMQQPQVPCGYVPPQNATTPQLVPMNYTPTAYQMPGYLTVPEPTIEGQHWAARLGLTLIRSLLKAAGHTAANFFDHSTFGRFPKQ